MLIETKTFRLRPGTDEAAFVAADERILTEVAYLQAGIVRRTTARGADGSWLVLTVWKDEGAADAAAPSLAAADPASPIDPATVETRRYSTLD